MDGSNLRSIPPQDVHGAIKAHAAAVVVNLHRRATFGFYLTRLVAAALLTGASGLAFAADDGWQARVGEALGKTGSEMPGGVYRVGLPRSDLKATLDGVALKPGFALGGWLALRRWAIRAWSWAISC